MVEAVQSFAELIKSFAGVLGVSTPILTIIALAGLFTTAYDMAKKSYRRY